MAGSDRAVKRGAVIGAATTAVALVAGVAVFVAFRDDGSNAWVYETGRSGIEHLVTDGETVCGIDSHGAETRLVCLDGATGEQRFDQVAPERLVLDTIEDGILLANDLSPAEPTLEAYSLDGEHLWSVSDANQADDTATADGVVLVMEANDNPSGGFADSDLVAVDLASGDEQWRIPAPEREDTIRPSLGDGVFAAGGLFLYSALNQSGEALELVALDPSSGDEVWRTAQEHGDLVVGGRLAEGAEEAEHPGDTLYRLGPIQGAVALDDGETVAVVETFAPRPNVSRLVVVDAGTGEPRQVQSLDASYPTVAHMDGVIVTLSGTELQGWNSDGEELWTVDAPGDSHEPELVPGDDSLYFTSQGLYEVDVSTGETTLLADRTQLGFRDYDGRNWAMTDDRLVLVPVSGAEELQGVPVDDLPLAADDD